jgi:hypothetical protein
MAILNLINRIKNQTQQEKSRKRKHNPKRIYKIIKISLIYNGILRGFLVNLLKLQQEKLSFREGVIQIWQVIVISLLINKTH